MEGANEVWFDHEKLEVYREAIAFVAWVSAILESAVRVGDVKDQLDRASTSVALNIAEGNGKYSALQGFLWVAGKQAVSERRLTESS